MFTNSENCDPNRVWGSLPWPKPHFVNVFSCVTDDVSNYSQLNFGNCEWNHSQVWALTHHSQLTVAFFNIMRFLQKRKTLKIKWFQRFAAICHFVLWPRRDLPETGSSILSINTLDFLKIMDVPFLHTRTFQCSSYIYNAKVAIIVWFQAVFSVKNSF